MTSVIEAYRAPPSQRSEGVWLTAWRRLKSDRLGMASLAIVGGFLVMILAAALGLVAGDWQKELGVPDAPPSFVGPRPAAAATDPIASVIPKDAKPVDLSDIDPLAPKYKEWAERAAKIQIAEPWRSALTGWDGTCFPRSSKVPRFRSSSACSRPCWPR